MNRFILLKRQSLVLLFLCAFMNLQGQIGGLSISEDLISCNGKTVNVDIMTDVWNSVTSMQFTLEWDPTVLQYNDHSLPNNTFSEVLFGNTATSEGKLNVSWFDGSSSLMGLSTTAPVLCFRVTFDVIGEQGDESPIAFTGNPTIIEFSYNDNGSTTLYTPVLNDGKIKLDSPFAGSGIIQNATATNADGAITITPSGGVAPYSIEWNNAMTGETISNITAGTYNCTITDANVCSTVSEDYTVESTPSATNEIESLTNFELLPNPASDIVNVKIAFAKNEYANIRVLNVTGTVIYESSVSGTDLLLDIPVTNFSNGTYFLEIKTEEGSAVQKLIVAK